MRKKRKLKQETISSNKENFQRKINATNNSKESMRPFKKVIQKVENLVKQNKVTMFPKESKNIPKNLCRALKFYIVSLISDQQIKQNQILQAFVSKNKQYCGKNDLDKFLNTKIGRQIGDRFFGDLQFAIIFIKENKIDLDSYFRVLDKYFLPQASQLLNQRKTVRNSKKTLQEQIDDY